MASLIERGDYWYIKMVNAAGRQKMIKGYTDKRETQALANRLEDEKTKIRRGDIDPKNEARKIERAKPIEHHVEQYETSLKSAGRQKNHVAYTIRDIRQFIAFSGVTHADAVTRAHAERWSHALQNTGNDSNTTVNRRLKSLQAFLKYLHQPGIAAVSEYVLHKLPKLPVKGHETRRCRALTVEEQRALLAFSLPQDRADVYRFALGTGARASAIRSLKVRDVNFSQNVMALKAKHRTETVATYIVPINPSLTDLLHRRCDGKPAEAVVFDDMPGRTMAEQLRDDCEAARIDTTDVSFHGLRHTFITTLAQAGAHPVVTQKLAGHRDVSVTLGFYTHWKTDDELAALKLLPTI